MQACPIPIVPSDSITHRRIRPLAQLFALKYAEERNLPPRPLSMAAEDLIASFDWNDDLTALTATIRHAVIMGEGAQIEANTIRLPNAVQPDKTSESVRIYEATRGLLGHTVAAVERELVLLTVECCNGNRTRAATVLDISVRTLRNKLKEYSRDGIEIPTFWDSRKKQAGQAKAEPHSGNLEP